MEIRLLGKVGVVVAGEDLHIERSHRRCLLAVLAMTPGQPVASETLIDRVWGEHPPRQVRHSLHTHISAIRRLIGSVDEHSDDMTLRRVGSGYVLEVDADQVDLHRSRQLAEQGRAIVGNGTGDDVHAAKLLREACSLWRGTPLGGLSADWAVRVRDGLDQERLALFIDRYTVELRLGEHGAVLGSLASLLAEYPLVEPLVGLQMLALYRAGRLADALDSYTKIRQRLVDEIGDEPGPDLRQLHEQLLRRDPGLDLQPAEVAGAPIIAMEDVNPSTPAQLPPDIAVFAGRGQEFRALDELVRAVDRQEPGPVLIAAISGPGGIGKTALAVHWAHRVAARFPDGQLYANLAGYGPEARPKDPIDILHGFLEALQIPAERIPRTPDALTGMYRSLLNDRRMLVVLDNARDADQIRPLLPGRTSCLVLVTSRSRLTDLIATEGAHTLTLGRLAASEARQLLERRLGTAWVSAEPAAIDEIITRCGSLPLALATVAARATSSAVTPARDLAAELREADSALDVLSGPDARTNLRAVMSWSYRGLSTEAAGLFRLLGLWPGPGFSVPAVASFAGIPTPLARRLLDELAQAHLINEHAPGIFGLHNLLREYAAELIRDRDAEAVRDAATRRVLDYYVQTANRAAKQLNPQREPISLVPPPADVPTADFDDQQAALAWLSLECANIWAWLTYAARNGYVTQTWQLAWATPDFLKRQGRWDECADVRRMALDAATRLGGSLCALGRYDDALEQLDRALECFTDVGHRIAYGRSRPSIGVVLSNQGRFEEALGHARQALALCEEDCDVVGSSGPGSASLYWSHEPREETNVQHPVDDAHDSDRDSDGHDRDYQPSRSPDTDSSAGAE